MKTYFVVFTLLITSVLLNAQESKLYGSWLMTKAETGNGIEEPYFITEYRKDGKMLVMEVEVGTWEMKNGSIEMKSKMDRDFNGTAIIEDLTKKVLVLTKDDVKMFYIKLDEKAINKGNKNAPFFGLWKMDSEPEINRTIEFTEPNNFVYLYNVPGMSSTEKGTWIYNEKEQYILFQSFSNTFRGKEMLKIIDENTIELKGGETAILKRYAKEEEPQIERLNYEYNDFPEELAYSDLPWSLDNLTVFAKTIEVIKYAVGEFIVDQNDFRTTTLITKTEVYDEADVEIIFNDFTIEDGDTNLYYEHYLVGEFSNMFFPEEDLWPFRIVSKEKITVAAGTFNCTVVEGFDNDARIKLWMIDEMPGVFARIIKEKEGVFDDLEYRLIELENITLKK